MRDAMRTVACASVAVVVLSFTGRRADRASSFNVHSFALAAARVSYLLVFVLRRLSTSAAGIDPAHGRELAVISRLVPANDRLPFEQIAPPVALFPAPDRSRASEAGATFPEAVGR
jgi:hypothetical protein